MVSNSTCAGFKREEITSFSFISAINEGKMKISVTEHIRKWTASQVSVVLRHGDVDEVIEIAGAGAVP